MPKVKFGDLVKEVKNKVDRSNNPYEFYVAGDHMDTEDLRIHRKGCFATDDVGPAFIREFKKGQILYGSRRTYLKKVAVADFDGVTANTTFVLESKDNTVLLQSLLPFIMLSDGFTKWSISKSKGSTNPYVLFSDLASYEFELPDINAQRRLSELLWAGNALKESYRRAIIASDDLLKSRFNEMVKSATLRQKISDCIGVLYGFPFDARLFNTDGNGKPLIRIRDINTGFSGTYTTEVPDEKYIVHEGECLIGMDGIFEVVKWRHQDAYLNQRVCKITPLTIQKEYMIHFMRDAVKKIEQLVQGTTVKHLSAKDINSIMVPIPDDGSQKDFEALSLQVDKSKFMDRKILICRPVRLTLQTHAAVVQEGMRLMSHRICF